MEICAGDSVTWESAVAEMKSFSGMSVEGVDTSTLTGKVVVGYQGWFNTPNDGYGLDWKHYKHPDGKFQPGSVSVDFWPHTAEFEEASLEKTLFRKKDGSIAHAFSSTRADVVDTHFRWMKVYGIEAAFLQRFAGPSTTNPRIFRNNNRVLELVRASANRHGRAYVVMYDMSGVKADKLNLIKQDWKRLVDHMGMTKGEEDHAYLHHRGKPVVALWGAGFKNRPYTMAEILDVVRFFKDDPEYGGLTVMVGVPTGWRELTRDCIKDPQLHEIIRASDVISPWTPGRFNSISGADKHAREYWLPDLAWCSKEKLDYLPVVFPGFSWGNLKRGSKHNAIPRRGGHFLWQQYASLIEGGATMIYQAMFDEVDEGTQICKIDNNPPVGKSKFLSYAPQPEDHYLWLVGQAQKMLRNPKLLSQELPKRNGYPYPVESSVK